MFLPYDGQLVLPAEAGVGIDLADLRFQLYQPALDVGMMLAEGAQPQLFPQQRHASQLHHHPLNLTDHSVQRCGTKKLTETMAMAET